ncbi:hypothetical protein LTR17_003343 [Elasticomyces elasticus]|nr:hypothetical protein LTR17_003343 [Elasticomyces elasticus]
MVKTIVLNTVYYGGETMIGMLGDISLKAVNGAPGVLNIGGEMITYPYRTLNHMLRDNMLAFAAATVLLSVIAFAVLVIVEIASRSSRMVVRLVTRAMDTAGPAGHRVVRFADMLALVVMGVSGLAFLLIWISYSIKTTFA